MLLKEALENQNIEIAKKKFNPKFHHLFKKLFDMGYKLKKQLGAGSNGVAYELEDGTVLKITMDIKEARAAAKLVGKKNKYIVNFYRSFTFEKYGNLCFIHQEKLRSANIGETYFDDYIFYVGDDRTAIEFLVFYITKNKATGKEINAALDKIDDMNDPRKIKFLKDMIYAALELKQNGITYGDLHSENVMKDDKNFKIIDLGISESDGKIEKVKVEKEYNG